MKNFVIQHRLNFFITVRLIVPFNKIQHTCLVLFINIDGTTIYADLKYLMRNLVMMKRVVAKGNNLYNGNLTLFSYILLPLKWHDFTRSATDVLDFSFHSSNYVKKHFGSFLSFYHHNALLGLILFGVYMHSLLRRIIISWLLFVKVSPLT